MLSVRNGVTFILIGGVIMLFDFGFRSSMESEAWLEYDLGFVRFSAWIAGVVIAGGIAPDKNTMEKAAEEKVPLYITDMSLFEVAGKLYSLGVQSC